MSKLFDIEATGIRKFYQHIPELGYSKEKRIPVILAGEITNYLCLRYLREDDEKENYHFMTTIDVISKDMCICAPAHIYGDNFGEILDTLFRYSVDRIDIRKIKAFVICNDDDCYEMVDNSYYNEDDEWVDNVDWIFNEDKLKRRCLDEETFRNMVQGLDGNFDELIKEQMNFKYNKED